MEECIYCGLIPKQKEKLSDEHVIPFGLNGELVVEKASCEECAKITSQFERTCLRELFILHRAKEQFKSYRKKSLPNSFEIIDRYSNGAIKKRLEEIAIIPSILVMNIFPWPGIIKDKDKESSWGEEQQAKIILSGSFPPVNHNNQITEMGMGLPTAPLPFARMLAKIAYGVIVAEHGPKDYKNCFPELNNIILGRGKTNPAYLVGCYASGISINDGIKNGPHITQLVRISKKETSLYACRIKLFSNLNTPTYIVVVGELSA